MYYGVSEMITIEDCCSGDMYLLIEQYAEALRNSQECARCEMCFDKHRPSDVLLMTMFHDAAAAERHDASEIRRDFEVASTPMILTRKLQSFSHVG